MVKWGMSTPRLSTPRFATNNTGRRISRGSSSCPMSKKKKNKELPPARVFLNALAGVLSMGLPYERGRCASCGVKQDKKHHAGCLYLDALHLVLRYYKHE